MLLHADGAFRADWAIACAGLWSDRLAECGGRSSRTAPVVPFRGAYLRLANGQRPVVRGMVYPVPDPALPFLGVHITRHIDGGVMLGPTALLVAAETGTAGLSPTGIAGRPARWAGETLRWPGTWMLAKEFWRTGATELAMASSRRLFV